MRARLTVMFVATAVFAVACGPGQDATTPSSTTAAQSTTGPQAERVAFAYSYEPGDHHDYAFALDQNLQMTVVAEGDESLLGADPFEDIYVTTTVSGTVAYDIAEGPEPGTRQISISGVFDELDIAGTIDGEPIDKSMVEEGTVPDLVEVPDLTIVIDERGRLVSIDGENAPEDLPFFGDPFSELGDFTTGGLGGHFGPAFPDEPLAVGDTWSTTESEEMEELGTAMSITSTYEVTGMAKQGGHDVAVIEFTTETSEVVLDLGEMFQQLFDAFGELGSELSDETTDTAVETPKITFLITVAPSSANGTVWFDQAAGVVKKYAQDTTTTISMLMDFSDAEAVVRTAVTMDLDMALTAELLEGPSA
ncbi:MAG: hypothetical protein OEM81_15050 [Acidimicrobiia bacterium]|nr:hypothetical protein [Acidimicrobiia bacterium]MDH3399126.1 hypothetical protein [Acidimicrobiia bacterium]MDH5615835.1 hypothetical protein [Acidimicrobiia bacterium]